MKQRDVAVAFVLFQLLCLFMVSELRLLPVAAAFLALLSLSTRWDKLFGDKQWVPRLLLLTLMLFVIGIRIASSIQTPTPYGIFEFFAEALILAQLYELHLRNGTRLPEHFPGLGIIAFSLIFVRPIIDLRPEWMIVLAAIASGFAIFLMQSQQDTKVSVSASMANGKRTAVVYLTVLIGFVGWLLSGVFAEATPRIANMLIKAVETRTHESSALQYVSRGSLGSIRRQQLSDPRGVALTIYADQAPGYMRGASFEMFDGRDWRNAYPNFRTQIKAQVPAPTMRNAQPGQSVFFLQEPSRGELQVLAVESDPRRGSHLFHPLGTEIIVGSSIQSSLTVDLHGIVRAGVSNKSPYQLHVSASRKQHANENYLSLISRPISDPNSHELLALSGQVVGDAATTSDKIQRVERFFHDNFDYSLDVRFARTSASMSRLATFLLRRRTGHCEYFATAACLLLRYQGVPCRFTVGYRVYEMNDDNEYYLARNMNAHAWVEAYDRQRGAWTIVEATPGIASPYEMDTLMATNDTDQAGTTETDTATNADTDARSQTRLSRLASYLDWRILRAVLSSQAIPLSILALIASAIAIRGRLSNRDIQNQWQVKPSKQLRIADRRAKKLGFARKPSETLHQFAQRLHETAAPSTDTSSPACTLAQWYIEYATERYHPDTSEWETTRQQHDGP